MNRRYREPWGDSCPWPREDAKPDRSDRPRIDTADARKARQNPNINEAAAHRAAERRSRKLQGLTSGGRRL